VKEIVTHTRAHPIRRLAAVALLLAVYSGLTAWMYRVLAAQPRGGTAPTVRVVTGSPPPRRTVAIRDGWFVVGGKPFFIKAVGWDPARPGELPWTRHFQAAEVDADFRRIRAAGFNTVRTWAPMRVEELELAGRNGLRVLQGIWTPPDADFRDPAVRRRVLDEVARSVEASRWSPAIIGYLVLNEPRAQAVARAGLEATAAWLREIVATVRALDPGAPIGYSSWPGMEALDDDLLDFVAFNLYPHRPRAAMDELGIAAYARLLRDTVARGRPFLVSEFGLSVSPQAREARGGLSEAQQAGGLVGLASAFASAGVAGTVVFQWNDGWWKNGERPGDELSHDPDDPEEWFGLLRFDGPQDRIGTPRPALAALARYNRAVVVEPRDGVEASAEVPIRVFSEEPVEVAARVDGARVPLVLERSGPWHVGRLALPASARDRELVLELRSGPDLLREERRLLSVPSADAPALRLASQRRRVRPGETFSVAVSGKPGGAVRLAAYTEDHFDEQPRRIALDQTGRGNARFRAPSEETVLTLLGFTEDPHATERRAGWTAVEVRRAP
jgi:exo-beta-1,3-glucanase (GH17 family)